MVFGAEDLTAKSAENAKGKKGKRNQKREERGKKPVRSPAVIRKGVNNCGMGRLSAIFYFRDKN